MRELHDLPELEKVTNFRELGGIETTDGRRVKRRRLFRSSHWGRASEADVSVLEELGVGLVIDFRSDADIELEGPDRLPAGARLLRVGTEDPAGRTDIRTMLREGDLAAIRRSFGGDGAHRYMEAGAARLVTHRTGAFGRFLASLCEPDLPPVLFHCSAGKDRAGWAASVTLLALGVHEDAVAEHYLLSNEFYRPDRHGGWGGIPQEIREMLAPVVEVRVDYIAASLASVKRCWGSFDDYLRDGLGISDAQRSRLHDNWLE